MKYKAIVNLIALVVITAWLFSLVHQQIPIRSTPEEVGWWTAISFWTFFIVTFYMGWDFGREFPKKK